MPGLRLVSRDAWRAAAALPALPLRRLLLSRAHHSTPPPLQPSLLQYVQKEDGMFSWTDTGIRLNGTNDAVLPKNKASWIGYVLNVTSQKVRCDGVCAFASACDCLCQRL